MVSKCRCLNSRENIQPSKGFFPLLLDQRICNLLHIFLESLGMKQRHQQLFCWGQPSRPVRMGQARGGSITDTSTALQSPRARLWKTTAESVSRLCWQEGEMQLHFQTSREGICIGVTQRIFTTPLSDEQKQPLPHPHLPPCAPPVNKLKLKTLWHLRIKWQKYFLVLRKLGPGAHKEITFVRDHSHLEVTQQWVP